MLALRLPLLLSIGLALAAPGVGRAGDVACRYENGAVVVEAAVAGLTGDYILDPSTPQTLLHETRAQGAGYADTSLDTEVQLAGQHLGATVAVTNLDARSQGFSTPIAGVIGADALAGMVLDLQLTPCRLGFYTPGTAPVFPHGQIYGLRMVGGVPAVEAGVTDNTLGGTGLFAIDTGSAAMVRLSDRLAVAVPARDDAADRAHAPAHLAALSFAGVVTQQAPAGLATGMDPQLSGALGNGVWVSWRLRLDLSRSRLTLVPVDGDEQ